MLCKNCGSEFNGNFCSHCGNPAPSCMDRAEYPPAPVGEYQGSLCAVILSNDAITIRKNVLFNKSEETILYSDLCNVSFKKGVLGGFICVRGLGNQSTPMSTSMTSASDPFSADFAAATGLESFYAIYEFLQSVVAINDHPIYEPTKRKDIPSFKQWRHETVQPAPQYKPESVQIVVAEHEKPHKMSKRELKIQAHNSGQACCPKCGSTSLSANKKGFGVGKAVAGVFVAGPIGLIAGNLNAKKVWVTCLNCGKRWKM